MANYKFHGLDQINLDVCTLIYVSLLVMDVRFSKPWMLNYPNSLFGRKVLQEQFLFCFVFIFFLNCIIVFYYDLFKNNDKHQKIKFWIKPMLNSKHTFWNSITSALAFKDKLVLLIWTGTLSKPNALQCKMNKLLSVNITLKKQFFVFAFLKIFCKNKHAILVDLTNWNSARYFLTDKVHFLL